MSDPGDGDSYRDKYRSKLEELDQLERKHQAQIDVLRQALIGVGSTALGLDDQLDKALERMLVMFRSGDGAEIFAAINGVNTALKEFEESRPAQTSVMAKDFSMLIQNLLELNIPRALRVKLNYLNRDLEGRLIKAKNYAAVVEDFGKLQLLALTSASQVERSFWERVRSGRTLSRQDQVELDASGEDIQQEFSPINLSEEAALLENSEQQESEEFPEVGSQLISGNGGASNLISAGTEDDFREVAERITMTIDGLVEKIEPNDVIKHKIDIVKLRLKRGMDWYSLAITLEDLRDILLLRYLQTDKDFSDYLKRVNSQLQVISESLGLAVQREESLNNSADLLSNNVSQKIGLIEEALESTDDIGVLKSQVSGNLSAIQGALSEFKESQANRKPLSEQLVALVNQVQAIEEESLKNKELLEEERYKATHDSLTGLPNREAYNERGHHELQRFRRYERPLVLAVADIDRFKKINDTYGHQVGDNVLKFVGKLIASKVRKVDFVARYGGEEFVILLPETTLESAGAVLNKIREHMANTPVRFKDEPIKVTISVGYSAFTEHDDMEEVFERADAALYEAKENGRNQCVVKKV